MKKCKTCKIDKNLDEFYSNGRGGKTTNCKNCDYNRIQKYKMNRKLYQKRWNDKNKEKLRKYRREYQSDRLKKDEMFKLIYNMRIRLRYFLINQKFKKNDSTKQLIGCDIHFLRKHIESQFKENMSWDNYGKWHIDHIKPLSLAKDESQFKELCNYKNLQPLWAEENFKKSNKY